MRCVGMEGEWDEEADGMAKEAMGWSMGSWITLLVVCWKGSSIELVGLTR